MFERNVLSRDEWNQRGRVVTVDNSEAVDVVLFWGKHVRGARHVFAESQTVAVEAIQIEQAT
jgi:hypothetical protein